MTTREFVQRCVDGLVSKDKTVSRVWYDGEILYSYGSHYPLAIPLVDKTGQKFWIINDEGYSNTTAKHIRYALEAAYYNNFVVHFAGLFNRNHAVSSLLEACDKELFKLNEKLSNLSKRAWKQTEVAAERKAQVQRTRAFLSSL